MNLVNPVKAPRAPLFDETGLTIVRVETRAVNAPTIRAHKLSNTEISHKAIILVRVILSDGSIGYGEGSTLGGPRWAEESPESIRASIDRYLAPAILCRPANRFEAAAHAMARAAVRNTAAKAAVESALYDAVGHSLGLPAAQLLGGRLHDRFEVIWALASGDADQEIDEARAKFSAREHRRFKVKIGFAPPENDLARLRRLTEALPDCDLIVDVNQGWTAARCNRWMPALEELGIALVEQPVPAQERANLARVTARSRIPVMIDEGAFSLAEVAEAGARAAGTVLSLKLVKSGGLQELKRAAGIATAHGMELYGGCLLESGIGTAAHLAVFSTLPKLHWGTEHFGAKILTRDLTCAGIRFADFHIECPTGPGLGVTVDEAYIEELADGDWRAATA
ncbi:muconate/chloromuconate family cycloisomerase [Stappia indica]|uniref:muconate/chloromuconate family cycloisomerase n=1 Tax=Stappia indica TaxID=538381 RepID=UPI001CD61162|nr:muconate/chloromuconate family cycloisomerase [Stappia indica]MCA1300469.1 muconate/chloromuconate family cycloisomerase [Stappia indica]